jgi:hypothetical protein
LPSLFPDAIGRTTRIVAAAAAAVDRIVLLLFLRDLR